MMLPDVIESSETCNESRVLPLGPLGGFMAGHSRQARTGPHVNQLDRDAIEDRGLSYFVIEDGHQTGEREAVMPS
ncbi:hypothetical protein A5710_20745 [Mycolicibacter sinensis]|uniref:Uncharacterized protein n=1 Tax=Mycolicibacter sinensis (strain JDM601) TaxID=875328 RepID=A0A1A2XVN6_MYCSD|nr:hypothetical protein A5710_20745 [Mycolicibacter sinensis]